MTPDDRAMARALRGVEAEAASLASAIEADQVPWNGELTERLRKMAQVIEQQQREVQRRRPPVSRGSRW